MVLGSFKLDVATIMAQQGKSLAGNLIFRACHGKFLRNFDRLF